MSDSEQKAMADLALLENQADFAINLLRESALNGNATDSLIMSPISIALALSLAYVGGLGETRKQFETVFAKGASNAALDSFFQQALADIGEPKNVTLEVANRAYAEKTLSILESYRKIINEKYGGDFKEVDFIKNGPDAVKEINKFVEEKTHDKIKDLLSNDVVTPDTRLILVNAIYFKGDWATKFDEKRTVDQKFYVNENSEKQVKMMKMKTKVRYSENDEVQVLELPYTDKDVSFVAFLPKEKFGLNKFIQSLDGKKLLKLKNELSEQEVNIELPRFKIESQFELANVLKKLGLDEGFSGSANFSGITTDDKLYISDVIHKGFIEINEVGGEGAAATGLIMKTESFTPVTTFKAENPFAYAITLGSKVLFLGKFTGEDKK